jgi:hypothetical protein
MSVDSSFEHRQLAEIISGKANLSSGHRQVKVEALQATHTATDEPNRPLEEAAWSEAAIAQSASEFTKSEEFTATDAAWLLLPLWFAVVWVVVFFAFSEGWRMTRNKLERLQPASRIPCKHCRFYTSSAYLKCAVNPLDAATERAIACPDYDPKIENLGKPAYRDGSVKSR